MMDFYLSGTVCIQHRSKKGRENYSSRTDILWCSNSMCKFYLISCSEQYQGIKLQISCNEFALIVLLSVIFAFGDGLIYSSTSTLLEGNRSKHRLTNSTQYVCMGLPCSCNFFGKQKV